MRQTETIILWVLFLFFSFPSIQGEDDSNSSARLQSFPVPSTSSPPQRSSTAKTETLSRLTLLTTASEGDSRAVADLSANDTLSQRYNDTVNSTVAPGFPTGAAGTTVNTLTPTNSTSVPGSTLTLSQDGSDLPAGDNQTSTTSNTTMSTTSTTSLAKGEPETNTSATSPRSQTPSASTRPQITTSSLTTNAQSRGKSTTVTTKGTSSPISVTTTATTTITPTPTTTTTTQTTEFSSTPVLAKARIDNPSELNVGDNTEYSSTSMDPLLAGLVSVFVVTAAIVALLIFLKFRHRNERPEFRRLQDLPMDDMMEDTPLSMYSY